MNRFRLIGVSLILVLSLATSTPAQGPKKDSKAVTPQLVPLANWNEKKIAFELRRKPWGAVFEWLGEQAGLPYASPYPAPPGTFTFINPKTPDGKLREYTLAEVFDIINEILQGSTKHTLIRREKILTMVPAGSDFEDLLPLVKVEDLKNRCKTELVRVIVTFKGHNVEDVASQVKMFLGDFSQVTPLPETNQMVMRATVASLRLALEIFNPDVKDGFPSAVRRPRLPIFRR